MIFFEGGTFVDRQGTYVVNQIGATGMIITYEDGASEFVGASTLPIKERIHQNIYGEFARKHPSTKEEYFFTLGFLARYARFKAELPEHTVNGFKANYEAATGKSFPAIHPDIRYEFNPDIWGAGLRIIYPKPDFELDFGSEVEVEEQKQSTNMMIVSRNKLWLMLVELGFRLGVDHDVDRIRKSILDKKDQKFFEKGLNYSLTNPQI